MPRTSEPGGRGTLARRILLALIALLVAWAPIVALTGGVDFRPLGIPFRSTNASRIIVAAAALMALYAAVFRGAAKSHFESLDSAARRAAAPIARHATLLAVVLAVATFAIGMLRGVHVAGGSDSWGYVSQARLWLAGDLIVEQPIATQVPWPEADWTFAPLGYRSGIEPGSIVPVYAPGLPVLMALATIIVGACGPFVVVPLLGAWMVFLAYRLGAQVWSPLVGLASAALLATSPTFVYMLLNPMSDVPASAFFLVALVAALSDWRRRALWTGAAVSVAIFIRPNLVPVGAVFLAIVLARAQSGRRWQAFAAFALGGLPLVAAVAALNTHLYGAPWKSGYGDLEVFYAWEYLWPNVIQYSGWLLRTETPVIALSMLPLAAAWRSGIERKRTLISLYAFVAAAWICYAFYTPFDAWWYLRFLLPAFAAVLVLTAVGAALAVERFGGATKAAAFAVLIALAAVALRLDVIRAEGILRLPTTGVVYLSTADYVRKTLPSNAVLLTVEHSGSLRYYTGRLTMRWDWLAPEWWPRAIDELVRQGYRPYVVLGHDQEQFRSRFGLEPDDTPGTLVAQMDLPEPIRIYDPLRQQAGAAVIPRFDVCPCGMAPSPGTN